MEGCGILQILTVYLLSFCMTCVDADCVVQKGQKSNDLLKRLDPIKGRKFKFTYKDESDHDQYQYLVSICEDLDTYHAGVIQTDATSETGTDKGTNTRVVGRVNDTSVKAGTDWIMLTYKGGDKYHSHCENSARQSHIMINCNPDVEAGNFVVLYEENKAASKTECYYLMELESSVACSKVDSSYKMNPTGLSTGSVILIVLATLIFVYLSVGMLYKRCVHAKKGVEQVPNIGFWRTCGSLQADGCDLLCRCQESGFDSSRPYRGIADDQLDDEADDENLLPM